MIFIVPKADARCAFESQVRKYLIENCNLEKIHRCKIYRLFYFTQQVQHTFARPITTPPSQYNPCAAATPTLGTPLAAFLTQKFVLWVLWVGLPAAADVELGCGASSNEPISIVLVRSSRYSMFGFAHGFAAPRARPRVVI